MFPLRCWSCNLKNIMIQSQTNCTTHRSSTQATGFILWRAASGSDRTHPVFYWMTFKESPKPFIITSILHTSDSKLSEHFINTSLQSPRAWTNQRPRSDLFGVLHPLIGAPLTQMLCQKSKICQLCSLLFPWFTAFLGAGWGLSLQLVLDTDGRSVLQDCLYPVWTQTLSVQTWGNGSVWAHHCLQFTSPQVLFFHLETDQQSPVQLFSDRPTWSQWAGETAVAAFKDTRIRKVSIFLQSWNALKEHLWIQNLIITSETVPSSEVVCFSLNLICASTSLSKKL